MKKVLFSVIIFSFIFLAGVLLAQESQKVSRTGTAPQAHEHASDQAIFSRVADWFATVGKPEEERNQILLERRDAREQKRLEKQSQRKQREAQRQLQQQRGRLPEQAQDRPAPGSRSGRP